MTTTTCTKCGMTLIPIVNGRIARHGNLATGECRKEVTA